MKIRPLLDVGILTVPDFVSASCNEVSLESVFDALEEQLAVLDALGARIAAAHVSAAVEQLRLDVLDGRLSNGTRH